MRIDVCLFGAIAQSSVITAERENSAEAAGTTDPNPLPDTPAEPPKPLISMDFSSLQKDAETKGETGNGQE